MARTIITAEDVLRMTEGARLVVGDDTTVTGSARELARRRGVTIVEPAEGAAAAAGAGAAGTTDGCAAGLASLADGVPVAEVGRAPFVGGGAPGVIIVTAVGVNRPGVLSELSTAVGQLGGDIQDVSQRITGGYFNAILVVDIARSGQSFAAYRDALKALSEPSDYVVTVIDERVFTAMHRLG